jgi:hypothetical protein
MPFSTAEMIYYFPTLLSHGRLFSSAMLGSLKTVWSLWFLGFLRDDVGRSAD